MRTAVTETRLATIAEVEAREDLTTANWDSVMPYKDLLPLDPDWERYEALEKMGWLLVLGAFTEDNEMVGYSVGTVSRHMHCREVLYYHNESLFVLPGHGRAGRDLVEQTEVEVAKRGARFVCWHAKKGSPLDHLLNGRGYRAEEVLYTRKV